MGFTIDDAIDKCRDLANISALHHMGNTSQQWEQIAVWLERLRDASEYIQVADIDYASYRDGDTIYDIREKQRDKTIEQVVDILDKLSEGGEQDD